MLILKLHHIPYLTHCTVLHYIVLHIHKMNQLYLSDSWVGDKKKKKFPVPKMTPTRILILLSKSQRTGRQLYCKDRTGHEF